MTLLDAPSVGLLFYNVDAKGGIERQASQLAVKLVARGHRVVCVSTIERRRYGTAGIELPGVTVHRVPATRTPFFEEAARALYARAGGVDVIYAEPYRCGLHAARIAARTGTPVVVKFAGSGEYGDFRTMGIERRSEIRGLDRYVCMTDALRDEAVSHGLDAAKIVRIPNGVDLPAFAAPRREEPGLVLFVGRLSAAKRLAVLLRAIALVAGARLEIAGEGEDEGALRRLAQQLGLGDRVSFLGARSDIAALQARAQVFCLPSASEGLPNALLEALAAGTPSVVTDIAGCRDVARHEKEALLVPPDDEASLATAIARLLDDRALAARLSRAGRERASEFDLEGVADAYSTLFREVARPAAWRAGLTGRAILAARAVARAARAR